MSTALVPVDQVERMALAVAKSGLFGVKTPDQAMALMLIAQAEGLHPAIAARDYHIINNRPTLKADAMLARFHTAGGTVRWGEYTEKRVVGTFSHPQGGSVEIEWTLDMAITPWFQALVTTGRIPRITPEEAEDMDPQQAQPAAPRDMGTVVEVADFGGIMRQIDAAQTIDALNDLRPAIRTLDRDARTEAMDAAQVRAGQIRAAQAPVETLEANDEPI